MAAFPLERMVSVLAAGNYNWFKLVTTAEELGLNPDDVESHYESIRSQVVGHQLQLLEQSHAAYIQIERDETPHQE